MKKSKRVLVAMSGGVDSSMACYLLKEKGYECIGATIKTWPKEECGSDKHGKVCCSHDSVKLAQRAAQKMGVPHYVFDFSSDFSHKIKKYYENEYKRGRTPNPCVLCNSEIKFGLLLNKTRMLECDYVASGHYARIVKSGARYVLKRGVDDTKDQSYFLFNLKQNQLERILFPLGDMAKAKTVETAKKIGLKFSSQFSSQDICFELERIKKYVKAGDIKFTDGTVMGTHKGIWHYTIGQRKGLGIAYKEPLYVIGIDPNKNILRIGVKKDGYKAGLVADKINWIAGSTPKKTIRAGAKTRYGLEDAPCKVRFISEKKAGVVFDEPQFALTPGQAVVFYKGDVVLGGGWIREVS